MHLENLLLSNYSEISSTTFNDLQQYQNSPTTTSSTPYTPSIQQTPTTTYSGNYFNFEHLSQESSDNQYQTSFKNSGFGSSIELTEEQLSLERQFTSAFFDSVRLNETENIPNDDNAALYCDFEEPIERTKSPFYTALPPFQPFSSPTKSDSELSFSELSPLNFIEDESLSDNDINFDIKNELSNSSFNFDVFSQVPTPEDPDEGSLPSIGTFNRPSFVTNQTEINNFLRNSSATSIDLFQASNPFKNTYGHLLSTQPVNNNLSESSYFEVGYQDSQNFYVNTETNYLPDNQVIMTQREALDDLGVVTSTNDRTDNFTINFDRQLSNIDEVEKLDENEVNSTSVGSEEYNEADSTVMMQCKWADCYQNFVGETALVKHIEKFHIEVKRGKF